MVSGISAVGSTGSSFAISGVQLTAKTRSQLENLGIDPNNIKTEAEGQAALQAAQSSQQSQESQGIQQSQEAHKSHSSGGSRAAFESIKQEALDLAEKVGASVSSNDKLSDIMDKISQALEYMQAQATNDPQKTAQVAQYQAEFQVIAQSVQSLVSSQSSQQATSGASQLQASMTGLATYNIASISISSSHTGNTGMMTAKH